MALSLVSVFYFVDRCQHSQLAALGEVQPSAGKPDDYDNLGDNGNELPSFNDTSVQELLDRDLSSIGLDPAESMCQVTSQPVLV